MVDLLLIKFFDDESIDSVESSESGLPNLLLSGDSLAKWPLEWSWVWPLLLDNNNGPGVTVANDVDDDADDSTVHEDEGEDENDGDEDEDVDSPGNWFFLLSWSFDWLVELLLLNSKYDE